MTAVAAAAPTRLRWDKAVALRTRERATANNSAVRLALVLRAAQRHGHSQEFLLPRDFVFGAGDTAWAVISVFAPAHARGRDRRTACAVVHGACSDRCTVRPSDASAESWTVSNQQCIACDNSSISNACVASSRL